jgi:hypothetical protein
VAVHSALITGVNLHNQDENEELQINMRIIAGDHLIQEWFLVGYHNRG